MKYTPWLDLYNRLIVLKEMPRRGICGNVDGGMGLELESLFKPIHASYFSYWADCRYGPLRFSPQRQNIVLLMACLNNEL